MKKNNFVITATVMGCEIKRMVKFYNKNECNVTWVGATTNYDVDRYEYNTIEDSESLDDTTVFGAIISIDTDMSLVDIIRRDLDFFKKLSVYLQVNKSGDYNMVEKATIMNGVLIKYNRVNKIVLDLSRFITYEEFVSAYTGNDRILEMVDRKVFRNCKKKRGGMLTLTPVYDEY